MHAAAAALLLLLRLLCDGSVGVGGTTRHHASCGTTVLGVRSRGIAYLSRPEESEAGAAAGEGGRETAVNAVAVGLALPEARLFDVVAPGLGRVTACGLIHGGVLLEAEAGGGTPDHFDAVVCRATLAKALAAPDGHLVRQWPTWHGLDVWIAGRIDRSGVDLVSHRSRSRRRQGREEPSLEDGCKAHVVGLELVLWVLFGGW